MSTQYKFRLEHKGVTVAESDWSNILFSYVVRADEKRPGTASKYEVYNNVTGLLAGTPTKTAEPKASTKAATPKPRALKSKASPTAQRRAASKK